MSYVSIASKLKDVIDIVRDASGSKLATTFDFDSPTTDQTTGFPYAMVSTWPMDEDMLDSATNEALYTFVIRACDANKDKATMETNMRGLADDILAELRKRVHLFLDDTADKVLPFKVEWSWTNNGDVPMRVCDIRIQILYHYDT